jgi:hypothetical protein
MTKTLQEIQFFNRRKIFRAINGTEVCFSHIQALELLTKPLTFDRVLIAIRQRGYYDDIWFGENNDCSLEFDIKNLSWNLFKRTLEKQSEETQRAIYELLGGRDE